MPPFKDTTDGVGKGGEKDLEPLIVCLRGIAISAWNPPPAQRRMAGDLLYLEVLAIAVPGRGARDGGGKGCLMHQSEVSCGVDLNFFAPMSNHGALWSATWRQYGVMRTRMCLGLY